MTRSILCWQCRNAGVLTREDQVQGWRERMVPLAADGTEPIDAPIAPRTQIWSPRAAYTSQMCCDACGSRLAPGELCFAVEQERSPSLQERWLAGVPQPLNYERPLEWPSRYGRVLTAREALLLAVLQKRYRAASPRTGPRDEVALGIYQQNYDERKWY